MEKYLSKTIALISANPIEINQHVQFALDNIWAQRGEITNVTQSTTASEPNGTLQHFTMVIIYKAKI